MFPSCLVEKVDGGLRFCIDYRKVNAIAAQEAYPIPRIDTHYMLFKELPSSLSWIWQAYWQMPIESITAKKLAFTCHGGLYRWNVMPFGACTAPATLQGPMNTIFSHLLYKIILVYFDKIITFSISTQKHLTDLQETFDVLGEVGITPKRSKCKFF